MAVIEGKQKDTSTLPFHLGVVIRIHSDSTVVTAVRAFTQTQCSTYGHAVLASLNLCPLLCCQQRKAPCPVWMNNFYNSFWPRLASYFACQVEEAELLKEQKCTAGSSNLHFTNTVQWSQPAEEVLEIIGHRLWDPLTNPLITTAKVIWWNDTPHANIKVYEVTLNDRLGKKQFLMEVSSFFHGKHKVSIFPIWHHNSSSSIQGGAFLCWTVFTDDVSSKVQYGVAMNWRHLFPSLQDFITEAGVKALLNRIVTPQLDRLLGPDIIDGTWMYKHFNDSIVHMELMIQLSTSYQNEFNS